MILRIFLIVDNFEPGDSCKKNSYKKNGVVQDRTLNHLANLPTD